MSTDAEMVLLFVGKKIKSRRKLLEMKQVDLSDILSITRTSVANIESGRQNIGIARLVQISDALHCDLSDLLPKIRSAKIDKP